MRLQATTTTNTEVAGDGLGLVPLIITLLLMVILIAAMWRIFTKAGQAGWKSLIPFYNLYVLLKIVGRPGWWMLLLLIPIINIIPSIILAIDLAKSFGKGGGFAAGLILLSPIFYCILAFGSAQYQGPAGPEGNRSPSPAYA
jgi:hypothetical protein